MSMYNCSEINRYQNVKLKLKLKLSKLKSRCRSATALSIIPGRFFTDVELEYSGPSQVLENVGLVELESNIS